MGDGRKAWCVAVNHHVRGFLPLLETIREHRSDALRAWAWENKMENPHAWEIWESREKAGKVRLMRVRVEEIPDG